MDYLFQSLYNYLILLKTGCTYVGKNNLNFVIRASYHKEANWKPKCLKLIEPPNRVLPLFHKDVQSIQNFAPIFKRKMSAVQAFYKHRMSACEHIRLVTVYWILQRHCTTFLISANISLVLHSFINTLLILISSFSFDLEESMAKLHAVAWFLNTLNEWT